MKCSRKSGGVCARTSKIGVQMVGIGEDMPEI